MWLLFSIAGFAGDRLHSVVVDNPRAYGYHVGDSITQVLHIKYATDMELRQDGIPKLGNVTPWIKLNAVDIDEETQNKSRYTKVTLHYQISGFEQGEDIIETPEFNLSVEKGNEKIPIIVHAIPLHISHLSSDIEPNYSNIQLAPPLGPERKSTSFVRAAKWIAFVLGVFLFVTAAYRQVSFRDKWAEHYPFSSAYRDIRKLAVGSPTSDLEARRLLHAAFNQQFGRTLFESNLDQFFQTHSAFLKEETAIRTFFETSRSVFFATDKPDADIPESHPPSTVQDLARRCRSFENRSSG